MIFIFHGENTIRSRNAILGMQEKLGLDIRLEFPINEITPAQLHDACASFDIFGKPSLVVLDISGAGRMDLEPYIERCLRLSSDSILVVYSDKSLTKTNAFLKAADSLKARVALSEETEDSNIFDFVDQTFFKNKNSAYKELRKLYLEREDNFRIFSMMLYGMRNIAYEKFSSPALFKLAPFVRSKVEKQGRKFSESDVRALYGEFYDLDRKVKTGEMDCGLAVVTLLESINV
ncbi:MAG: hypothetical protein WC243_01230 [Patescibacteria group bacterium]|jgi:DNA polymerase III delta subunit